MSDLLFCKDCKYFEMTSARNLCGICNHNVYHTYADNGNVISLSLLYTQTPTVLKL